MTAVYPATYCDKLGEVETAVQNDGKLLSVVVRGVLFRGDDFDSLEPADECGASQLSQFTLLDRCLWFCQIETEIPTPVVVDARTQQGLLYVDLEH